MKKRVLGLLLMLSMVITLIPTTVFAADTAAKQNDIGAAYPAVFLEYKGYYYTLWEVNGAITRHKADGSENIVLFSYGGIDDLNLLRRGDYYTAENMKDAFVNMIIYQDKIYVSVQKNSFSSERNAKQHAAIYSMGLDGKGWTEVVKTSNEVEQNSGATSQTRVWCIWNDRIYYRQGMMAHSVNLTGGDKKTTSWKEYSDKINTGGAGEVMFFYGDEAYLARRSKTVEFKGDAPETEFFLRKVNMTTKEVTQYKKLSFKGEAHFAVEGWVYITNNKNEWWRVKADGSQESGEYLGNHITNLMAHNGDLYYIDANTKTAYKSQGLGPIKSPIALSKPEQAHDLTIAGDFIMISSGSLRTVTDLAGSKETFALAYSDRKDYMNSSLVDKTKGYVFRPSFRGAVAEASIVKPARTLADTCFESGRVKAGWYNLECRYKYIAIDSAGNAELRYNSPTTSYYIEPATGDKLYTIKTREGKYLSIAGEMKNGARVTTSDAPFTWQLDKLPGDMSNVSMKSFTIRPAGQTQYAANASEDKFLDGTPLILWQVQSFSQGETPRNAEIQLSPLDEKGQEIPEYYVTMSDWARPALGYRLNKRPYEGYGDDYTRPITREQMATAIMDMTINLTIKDIRELPSAVPEESVPVFTDTVSDGPEFLARWGITSGVGNNKFDPQGLVTREQMASFLVRAINYYSTYMKMVLPITKGDLSQFKDAGSISGWAKDSVAYLVGSGYLSGSGGNVNPGGYCTIEQALLLCDRLATAYDHLDSPRGELLQKGVPYGLYLDGKFTITSEMGGYVTINAEGKGVINKTQSQVFTRTFKKDPYLYTLQTADGKYLAISGLPEDGKQLIVQDEEYLWHITGAYGAGYDKVVFKPLSSDGNYFLNVSGFSKKDGAPVIVYTSYAGTLKKQDGLANEWVADNEKFQLVRVTQ